MSATDAANEFDPYSHDVLAEDLALFEQELKSFVPPNAFDAHAHLMHRRFTGGPVDRSLPAGADAITLADYHQRVGAWMGDLCPTGGLFFALPHRDTDTIAANAFMAEEMASDSRSRGLVLATPQCDPAAVEALLATPEFVGIKVYHVYAPREETFYAPIDEFLTEWMWELANAYDGAIMLHMVKPLALVDEENQRYIIDHCRRYPSAKLMLAHCGRSFCSRHTVDGIRPLAGLDNVFFDNSGICEPAPMEAILRTFGPSRFFFGTDHPISSFRGRCVSVGDGFMWTNEARPDWSVSKFGNPTLVGIESLLALKQAAKTLHLTDRDLEWIFCHGARSMLGLPTEERGPDVQETYRQARKVIPGGTQLLSKRPEMFAPDQWPPYYEEARGCEVIDINGNRYIDMSSGGILACILGYADPDVNAAVIRRVQMGSMATLQTADEVTLTELLLELHPWAHMARYARTGGESMAVAVRIARTRTRRDKVIICGYHGWHDWYLAANLATDGGDDNSLGGHLLPGLKPAGVPSVLAGTTLTFHYNRLDELDAVLAEHGDDVAAVVMETTRHVDPEPGFLEGVKARCAKAGACLIFDEISIGWRLTCGGAHLKFGVTPDIAVFAKTISNGFPMGAVIGDQLWMEAAQDSFISSAYWTEGVGPAAAVAAVRKMMQIDVPAHIGAMGSRVAAGWQTLSEKHGVPVKIGGRPEVLTLGFEHEQGTALTTLMTVRMLKRGFLTTGYFNGMLAHQEAHVDAYLDALDSVFAELAEAIEQNDIEGRIGGPVKHSHFARLTG